MRNVLIRLWVIVAMLVAAGYALADDDTNIPASANEQIMEGINASIDGIFGEKIVYYVYDSAAPEKINGVITAPKNVYRAPYRVVWGWVIYDDDAENCSKPYMVWSNKAITKYDHTFNVCDAPVTWLSIMSGSHGWEQAITSGSAAYTEGFALKFGPENASINPMPEMNAEFSEAPRDMKWLRFNTYTLRFFNKFFTYEGTPAGKHFSLNEERKVVYMGKTSDYIRDLSSNSFNVYKTENYSIRIEANIHKHYSPRSKSNELDFHQSCSSFITDISQSVRNEDKSNGGKPWEVRATNDYELFNAMLNLSDPLFKAEHTYNIATTCYYTQYGFPQVINAGSPDTGGDKLTFNHQFVVMPEQNTGNTSPAIILSLTGHFLTDGSIHVQGKFDDASAEQPAFKYAVKDNVSQAANWVAPTNVKWNPGNTNPANCPKCFSFVIPLSSLQDKNKINLVQILPDMHSNEQAAHPDVAAFTLRELINAGFVNAQGESWACGEENDVTPVKDNSGMSSIKMKLTVKHAVDNITGNIWLPSLPVTYLGNGTVSYSVSGQTAAESKDISINESDKGKSAVSWAVNTTDKVLKPGIYILTLPINVPAYRREDVGPESLSLYANVYAAKSILLKQRESSQEPVSVQCMDMFNGAAP